MPHKVLPDGFMGPGIFRDIEVEGEPVDGRFQVPVKGEVDGHNHVHHVFKGALHLFVEYDGPDPGEVKANPQKVILGKQDRNGLGIDLCTESARRVLVSPLVMKEKLQ